MTTKFDLTNELNGASRDSKSSFETTPAHSRHDEASTSLPNLAGAGGFGAITIRLDLGAAMSGSTVPAPRPGPGPTGHPPVTIAISHESITIQIGHDHFAAGQAVEAVAPRQEIEG